MSLNIGEEEDKKKEKDNVPPEGDFSIENTTVLVSTMDSEQESRRILKCALCPYKGKSNSLSKHMKHHRIKSKNSCPHCSYTSSYKAVLEKHISIHKADMRKQKLVLCQYCPYSGRREAFDYHVKNHFKKSKFRCIHCSYSSPYRSVTERHFKLHENNDGMKVQKLQPIKKNVVFPTQPKTSKDQSGMLGKILTTERATSLPLESSTRSIGETIPDLSIGGTPAAVTELSICPTTEPGATPNPKTEPVNTSSSKLNLLHGLKLLPVSRGSDSPTLRKHVMKPAKNQHHLYNHKGLQKRYPGFWCRLCPFTTISFANFQIHYTYHETKASKKCNRCNYSCNNLGSLKRHLALHGKKMSSPIKALYSPHEKRRLLSSGGLSNKTGRKDQDDNDDGMIMKISGPGSWYEDSGQPKPGIQYVCSRCPFITPSKDQYATHIKGHSGTVKTFSCDHCHYSTDESGDMESHQSLHKQVKIIKSTCVKTLQGTPRSDSTGSKADGKKTNLNLTNYKDGTHQHGTDADLGQCVMDLSKKFDKVNAVDLKMTKLASSQHGTYMEPVKTGAD